MGLGQPANKQIAHPQLEFVLKLIEDIQLSERGTP